MLEISCIFCNEKLYEPNIYNNSYCENNKCEYYFIVNFKYKTIECGNNIKKHFAAYCNFIDINDNNDFLILIKNERKEFRINCLLSELNQKINNLIGNMVFA